jgi:hypothetical protein
MLVKYIMADVPGMDTEYRAYRPDGKVRTGSMDLWPVSLGYLWHRWPFPGSRWSDLPNIISFRSFHYLQYRRIKISKLTFRLIDIIVGRFPGLRVPIG